MATKNTIIEINGKRYNAISGKLVHGSAKSIDGVVSSQKAVVPAVAATTPKAVVKSVPHAKPVMDIRPARVAATPAHARSGKPAGTLMRHVVHKPATSLKRKAKAQTSTLALAKQPTTSIVPKLSFHGVDARRQALAAKVAISPKVSRFGSFSTSSAGVQLAPFKVAKAGHHASAKTQPAITVSAPITPALDIFEHALAKATSHENAIPTGKHYKRPKKIRTASRRLLNYSAGTLAVLFVAGFLVYQNAANLTLKMAANKAGFAATLPHYHPAGFAIGKFSYSAGSVAINFHSNSDGRHFALSEKPSNWDSATLLNNFVATANSSSYQTVASAGRTIYLYGQNNATWVNNGVWYQIHGNGALSDKQLAALATSM